MGMALDIIALSFQTGSGEEITYQQPDDWQYSGDPSKLTLYPQKTTQATGTITKVILRQPAIFDDQSRKKLTEEARSGVPGGSTNITLVSQEMNPVKIGGKETFSRDRFLRLLWRTICAFYDVFESRV